MRTNVLLVIATAVSMMGLAAVSLKALAAPAPMNYPQIVVARAGEDECFTAARNLEPNPAACDAVIQREGVDAQTLAATFNNRGLMMLALELPEEALGDFDASLELSPDLIPAQVNRATTLFLLGRYAEALDGFDEILMTASTDRHVTLFNRALTHRAIGDVEQASRDLTAARHLAVQIRPTQTDERPPQFDPSL